ncbi:MAG: hypothetical protein QOD59_5564 [Mycobacterium sp.]|nr:hypothetical protein [Mycobacterium sp.]
MEWSKVKPSQLKLMAAGAGACAIVAMGALTVVFSDAPGSIGKGPEITLGETTTSTTAPAGLATSIASPTLTAVRPDGFAPGG